MSNNDNPQPTVKTRYTNLKTLFNDQAEYYHVCPACYSDFSDMQFAGSTRGGAHWREIARESLREHIENDGRCEMCDPEIGNGGWHSQYDNNVWPAMDRRAEKRKALGIEK